MSIIEDLEIQLKWLKIYRISGELIRSPLIKKTQSIQGCIPTPECGNDGVRSRLREYTE